MNKPRWLSHVNILQKMTMKKRIIHIELLDGTIFSKGKTKDKTDGGRLIFGLKVSV